MADAEKLLSWAVDEMNYRPRGKHYNAPLPTTEQLKMICTGQMKDIWTYVTTHVKSAQTIAKLKTSRKPSQDMLSGDGDNSSQKMKESMRKTQTVISQLEQELARVHKDIAVTKRKERVMQARVHDSHLRVSIIHAHSLYVQEQVAIIAEYTRHIQDKIDELITRSTVTESELYKTRGVAGDGQLESSCTALVRGACEKIGSYLQHIVLDKQTTDDAGKKELWQCVEEPLCRYPVSQLMSALSSYTQTTTAALQTKTSKIDLKADSDRLKFKYRQGCVEDTSQCARIMDSVHDMLQSAHAANIKKFVETEKLKSEAWHLTQRLSTAQKAAHSNIQSKLHGNTDATELAKKLLDVEKEVHVGKAALIVLNAYSSELQERIKAAQAQREEVLRKYNTIQDFKEVVDNKQAMIRLLVKQNLDARSQLQAKQGEIKVYEQQSELSQNESINRSVYELVNSMPREMELFRDVNLTCFITVNGDQRCPLSDLSIYQLSGLGQFACHNSLIKTCDSLEFPTYKASDWLMSHVVTLLEEAESLESGLETWGEVPEFKDLRRQVELMDEQHKSKLMSTLERKVCEADRASSVLDDITRLCAHWRDQPAQDITSWVTVDDRSLSEWKERWRVAATSVRQSALTRTAHGTH